MAGTTDVGLVAPSPRLGHPREDLFEQSSDDLEFMPTDPIIGPVSGARVFGHLEERFRSFSLPFRAEVTPEVSSLSRR